MSQLNLHHGHTTAEVSGLISVAWGSLARTENITLAPSCIVSTERGYYSQGSNRWIQFKHSTHTAVTQDLQGIGAENSTYTKYMHEKKKKVQHIWTSHSPFNWKDSKTSHNHYQQIRCSSNFWSPNPYASWATITINFLGCGTAMHREPRKS